MDRRFVGSLARAAVFVGAAALVLAADTASDDVLVPAVEGADEARAAPTPDADGLVRVPLRSAPHPEIQRRARALLDELSMGEERVIVVNGERYVFAAEPHYYPPSAAKRGPKGWHKGVTVYALRPAGEARRRR